MSGQPNSTDWSSYSLPQIRQMLSQESALAGDAQARVWYQIEAICRTHADQLARAVTQLQATWPATKGSAAEAFQAATNGLLRSMRETSRTAYNNGLTLSRSTRTCRRPGPRSKVLLLSTNVERRPRGLSP
ncbi:hypothetical protein ACFQX7_22595 [Luedemannella flava]